jgi:hypothetical protein
MTPLRLVQLAFVLLAAGAALLPLPPHLVERYFAHGFYPRVQPVLTSWSNETGVALFDFVVGTLGLVVIVSIWRAVLRGRRTGSVRPLFQAMFGVITVAAITYVWFLLAWGLNYSRPPLEATLGYDASRVSPAAILALAERATGEVNRTHAAGHAAGFPAAGEIPAALVAAMHDVERRLGRPGSTTPSRPKRTLLGAFFRASGVDGMHGPFLLETLLNPDLTPPERPAVLAHEWAHLAGYAPEDDASFVGLLAALRADPGAQYSAWLALFHETVVLLPRAEQQRLVARLAVGPTADRAAIARRLASRVEVVSRASWETYDRYLKAQGVREGVANYSRVVDLLLGSNALEW